MDTKQCIGCDYWKSANGDPCGFKFCHFLLDTGVRRKYIGDKCLSRGQKRKGPAHLTPRWNSRGYDTNHAAFMK